MLRSASRVALVHVDDVRNRVEREERDAERQRDRGDGERRDREHRRQRVDVGHREVRVLEQRERGEVAGDRHRQPALARACSAARADRAAHHPVERDRADDQRQVARLAPRVEREARDQQHAVAPRARQREVRRQRQRQEQEQEYRATRRPWRAESTPRALIRRHAIRPGPARGPTASRPCARCGRCGSPMQRAASGGDSRMWSMRRPRFLGKASCR